MEPQGSEYEDHLTQASAPLPLASFLASQAPGEELFWGLSQGARGPFHIHVDSTAWTNGTAISRLTVCTHCMNAPAKTQSVHGPGTGAPPLGIHAGSQPRRVPHFSLGTSWPSAQAPPLTASKLPVWSLRAQLSPALPARRPSAKDASPHSSPVGRGWPPPLSKRPPSCRRVFLLNSSRKMKGATWVHSRASLSGHPFWLGPLLAVGPCTPVFSLESWEYK